MDRDYYALKDYETYLHQLFPRSEIRIFTALSLLREAVREETPDVIIAEADAVPPQCLMKELREIAPETKAYFASASDRFAMDAVNAGASGYLHKPVTKETLRRELETLQHPMLSKNKKLFK